LLSGNALDPFFRILWMYGNFRSTLYDLYGAISTF
jgi:hypothetical protein